MPGFCGRRRPARLWSLKHTPRPEEHASRSQAAYRARPRRVLCCGQAFQPRKRSAQTAPTLSGNPRARARNSRAQRSRCGGPIMAISGFPGMSLRFNRQRPPAAVSAFRTMISGFVFFERIAAILALRSEADLMSMTPEPQKIRHPCRREALRALPHARAPRRYAVRV